ncbi:MAG: BNR-4 repeat-containing protein [Bacteroidota bacterium]
MLKTDLLFTSILFSILTALCTVVSAQKVTRLTEVKIADNGLYFDGQKRSNDDLEIDEPGFDYFFGRRITPHGDCVKQFGDYVFMSWWAGGEDDKHVMLSRFNRKSEVLETIRFPHTHVGFRHTYAHIGDSHNTIAVAVSPIDSTVHLLYDMHSYSENDFPQSFFNYSVSKSGAALVPDGQFTLDKFNSKRTYLNEVYNYSDITYPNFFLNNKNELFVWFREGGNNNGAYKFAKYNGQFWSSFTDFNVLNAQSRGNSYNWGLYGDMKYVNGKLRVGFVKRMNNDNDIYIFNNGFHYAYSNDPNGKNQWFNYKDEPLSLPIIDPSDLFFYEPGNEVSSNGANSVRISSGADWTVTDEESVHFIVNNVRTTANAESIDVHAFKKRSDDEFTISTDFPGGNLYAVRGNYVFLSGLNSSGKPYIYMTEGGTNNWQLLYEATDGKSFRHANVLIEDDKLFLYLMETGIGSAQPIYLQIYDLGLPEEVVLGHEETQPLSEVVLYPNPAKDNLSIRPFTGSFMSYAIYGFSGSSFLKGNTDTGNIDISSLAPGFYIAEIKGSNFHERIKFVVE